MISAFERLAAVSRRAVETVHGEPVTVRPVDRVAGVNGKPARSTTRLPYETAAVFYQDSLAGNPGDPQPMTSSRSERMINRSPGVTASIRLPTSDLVLRGGDMIERSEGRWYQINEINPDGLGGAMLTVSVAKPLEPIDA